MDTHTPIHPVPGAPAAHWGTARPDEQPSRADVAGLGRLVIEARARLGPAATPEAIAAELRDVGVDADPAEIAHHLDRPDRRPGNPS